MVSNRTILVAGDMGDRTVVFPVIMSPEGDVLCTLDSYQVMDGQRVKSPESISSDRSQDIYEHGATGPCVMNSISVPTPPPSPPPPYPTPEPPIMGDHSPRASVASPAAGSTKTSTENSCKLIKFGFSSSSIPERSKQTTLPSSFVRESSQKGVRGAEKQP